MTLTTDIDPGITLSADPVRLLQAIDNLVSNAVKYTPPGGMVVLTLRRRADDAVLDVLDTGIGIGSDDMDGLFTKFFRARNATALAIQGVGLGLTITRDIVLSHGGTITAESHEGIGTTMRVILPLSSLGEDAATANPPARLPVERSA